MGQAHLTLMVGDPSLETLRLAVASHYSDAALGRWRDRAQDQALDWAAITALAATHGFTSLLYSATVAISGLSPPSEPLAELKQRYHHTATHNMLADHDLQAILHVFSDAGIQVALLKGAALLHTVYDSPALRPMVDLDLLIPFVDLAPALDALSQLGYGPTEPDPFDNLEGLYWNELLLHVQDRTGAQLELHWNLLDIPYYASRLPVAWLLERAVPLRFGETIAYTLTPCDLLLHLCAHNILHHQGRLLRADVDVAFVASRYQSELDWDAFVQSAIECDLLLGVQQSLSRAAAYWFAPIPPSVLDALISLKPKYREQAMVVCQRSEFLKLTRTFATLPGAGLRYQYVKGQLFPSRDYLAWRYGVSTNSSAPVAYAKRYWSGLRGLLAELSGRSHAS